MKKKKKKWRKRQISIDKNCYSRLIIYAYPSPPVLWASLCSLECHVGAQHLNISSPDYFSNCTFKPVNKPGYRHIHPCSDFFSYQVTDSIVSTVIDWMQDEGGEKEKVWRCVLRNDAEEHVQSGKEVESGWGVICSEGFWVIVPSEVNQKGQNAFPGKVKVSLFLPKVSCLCAQLLPANMRLVYTEMFSDLFYSYTLKHTWSLHEETDFKNEKQRKHYSNNNKHEKGKNTGIKLS